MGSPVCFFKPRALILVQKQEQTQANGFKSIK
jgi:hypothetical protein